MYIFMPERFVLPFEYIDDGELNIYKCFRGVSEEEYEKVRLIVNNSIRYLFSKIQGYSGYITKDQLLDIQVALLKEFLIITFEKVSCVNDSGGGRDSIINLYLTRFKEKYNFHINILECKFKESKRPFSNEKFNLELKKILEEFKTGYISIINMTRDFEPYQIKDLFREGFYIIYNLYVSKIECFSSIKNKNIAGMNEKQLEKLHLNEFEKLYSDFMNVFNCK